MFDLSGLYFVMLYPQFMPLFNIDIDELYLFGFIWNQCRRLHINGYCGFSNQRIGEYICFKDYRVKRLLTKLKEKDLIRIENSKSYKRRIYINSDVVDPILDKYKVDQTDTISEMEAENKKLRTQLERLTEQLNILKNEQAQDLNRYTRYLTDLFHFTDNQLSDIQDMGLLYRDFVEKDGYSMRTLNKHFDYLKRHADLEKVQPGKLYNYLSKSLEGFYKTLDKLKKERSKPTIADGSTLPDWYKETDTTPASDELIQKALELQQELFGKHED